MSESKTSKFLPQRNFYFPVTAKRYIESTVDFEKITEREIVVLPI